jgi:hypothetical protein
MPSEALQQMSSLIRLDLSNNSIMELKSEHALPRLQKVAKQNSIKKFKNKTKINKK